MLSRIGAVFDPYIWALMAMVGLASALPAVGDFAAALQGLVNACIVVLFFLHGAKLSREAVVAGAGHWRLHLAVLAASFVLFPLLGMGLAAISGLPPRLATGLVFLSLLPSTVQSSIAFTAVARGNVAAAVCSAAVSNLLGIFLTPLLVAWALGGSGAGVSLEAVERIVGQLLVPFVAGHMLRPWIGGFIGAHKAAVGLVDRGSILLVVYSAFSAAVAQGLWHQLPGAVLAQTVALCAVLLAAVLGLTWLAGRGLGLARADAIVLQFCGSKKSLATGVPIAGVLFPASQVGAVILPLMVFHQLQLIACAILARQYGQVDAGPDVDGDAGGEARQSA